MKLVAAKCSSCGANIEVDKDSDKTKCEYCKTQILVDDAIQKEKVEHSGTIRIDGISADEEQLEKAKKHIKMEEYRWALEICEKVELNDEFNANAYYISCLSILGILKNNKNIEEESSKMSRNFMRDVETLNYQYKRYNKLIKKFDGKHKSFTKEEESVIKKYLDLYSAKVKDKEKTDEINNCLSKGDENYYKGFRVPPDEKDWAHQLFELLTASSNYKYGYKIYPDLKVRDLKENEVLDLSDKYKSVEKLYDAFLNHKEYLDNISANLLNRLNSYIKDAPNSFEKKKRMKKLYEELRLTSNSDFNISNPDDITFTEVSMITIKFNVQKKYGSLFNKITITIEGFALLSPHSFYALDNIISKFIK